jgi:Uncharacterized conserved protein
MRSLAPVTDVQAARANILSYAREVARNQALQGRISRHGAWYATMLDGVWYFGPSKFIGYQGINPKSYLDPRLEKHGSRTEEALKKLFDVVDPSSRLGRELYPQLKFFTSQYGKQPRQDFRISVAPDEIGSEIPASFGDSRVDDRIVSDPGICGGRPRIRGTRMRVSDIVEMIAEGVSREEIIADFPYVRNDDITAALRYAARATHHPVLHAA